MLILQAKKGAVFFGRTSGFGLSSLETLPRETFLSYSRAIFFTMP